MLQDWLTVTEDPAEIREIAKRIVSEVTVNVGGVKRQFYTPLMISKLDDAIMNYAPSVTEQEKEEMRLHFIYDYWVYGCTVDEEFYLHLKDKNDAEKREYMIGQMRTIYARHLNQGAGPDWVEKMQDKYKLYQLLRPYYKRDVIEIRNMDDYEVFVGFVTKHKEFVVKPSNFSFGIGVHKVSMDDYGNDCKIAMQSILDEGSAIHKKHPSRLTKMVLEEIIPQDESLAVLHPQSANAIRATAVRGKDGKIHIYHPWIKVGLGGVFVATAAQTGFDAEIDPVTGRVITDGYQENGNVYKIHPNSGIQIKGFQIPKWDDLVTFVNEIMSVLPEYGYVGWDLVLTPSGWCVMEGNHTGQFVFQMINGRGYKREFEELIGWKYEKDFWWREHKLFSHN